MTEKVKVSKEVAEAIEMLKDAKRPLYEMVKRHLNENYIWNLEFKCLDNLSNDDFIRALYVGCEVEQTPQEKLVGYYNHQKQVKEDYMDMLVKGQAVARVEAVDYVLETLNIKVEGVNA